MSRIAITGVQVYWFHLVNKLISEGHDVHGFDSYNDYYDPLLKEHVLKEIMGEHVVFIDPVDLKIETHCLVGLKNKTRNSNPPCCICRCS